jgi:FkbM family methyltransferase
MLGSILKDIYARRSPPSETAGEQARAPAAHQGWLDDLVFRLFRRMHSFEQDNFDADRYRNESSNVFVADAHAFYFLFLLRNVEHFFRARQLLEDEASRTLYDQLILFRLLGHLHVRLPFNNAENRSSLVVPPSWRVEETEDTGPFGPLSIFRVPGSGRDIRIKGWTANVVWTFVYRQYYFSRNGVEIKPTAGDHVIDAGGCFGDTAVGFADAVGAQGRVYVFDPLPKHCAIMRQQLEMNPALAPGISIFPIGLSDRINDIGPLPDDGLINPGARIIAANVPTSTIDEVVARNDIPRIDFIKMDIEGSELAALRGAEATIRRCKPKLAISLYHRPEDFFSIPFWVDSLGLGYRMFIDHYSIHNEETVLFATV